MMPSSSIAWRRSSYSNGMGGECVEMATASGVVAVRDSKILSGPQLVLSSTTWKKFIGTLCQTSAPR
ncbi:DUF397 domain-containing protein [Streptomyces sp. KS_5]|uniref:DUF397 domain-containing protein n=1 Tax=Streptomyces sp. KS_5 TaxID=1881018 RepID=UPI0008986904|nr:protein of unknown function [Streptomyces sp. KS_5]